MIVDINNDDTVSSGGGEDSVGTEGGTPSIWGNEGPRRLRQMTRDRYNGPSSLIFPTLVQMLDSIKTMQGEDLEAALEVVDYYLQNLSPESADRIVADVIPDQMSHPNSAVRLILLNQVQRVLLINPDVVSYPEIGVRLVKSIADDDLPVSLKATEIMKHGNWLLNDAVRETFENIMNYNTSSNRCKCYEIVIKLSQNSPEMMERCHTLGYLQKIISELDTLDFLLQLNIIELLSDMALVEHTLKYLIDHNVLNKLIAIAEDDKKNCYPQLFIPALMKFFGAIAYRFPNEIFTRFPQIINYLFDSIAGSDPAVLPSALDTLGFVGSTLEGKLTLCSLGTKITNGVVKIGEHIKNGPSEIRVRALNCLETLICIKDKRNDAVLDNRASLTVREWFRAISSHPSSIDVIYSICKNPFPDLQLAALGVLHSIAEHSWGQDLIKCTPGLVEFLMNRSLGNEKESKYAKFNIIEILSTSTVFDTPTLIKLKTYVKEGAFYVEAITEVAIEGD